MSYMRSVVRRCGDGGGIQLQGTVVIEGARKGLAFVFLHTLMGRASSTEPRPRLRKRSGEEQQTARPVIHSGRSRRVAYSGRSGAWGIVVTGGHSLPDENVGAP